MIKAFFDWLVPRYVTERVVLTMHDDGSYRVVCTESQYDKAYFNYIAGFGACEFRGTSRAFNLFGIALSPKVKLDI